MAEQVIYPSGKSLTWLPVTTLASGMELRLPLHHVMGAHPGPVLGITAGIHGDEYLPMEVVRQVVTGLDPASLHGSVLAIPVANPLAFEAQTRNTPHDMVNLNRVFPGDPNGWLTEQLASVICRAVSAAIECLIDLHCGGAQPTVDYAYILNDEAMSRAFGFRVALSATSPVRGDTDRGGGAQGHPLRGGGDGRRHAGRRALHRARSAGVHNVMKYLGMMAGEPVVPAQQTVVTNMARHPAALRRAALPGSEAGGHRQGRPERHAPGHGGQPVHVRDAGGDPRAL